MKIGFIGLGIMGSRMAANLIQQGFDLSVYNRDITKAYPLKEAGANIAANVEELALASDIIITMLSKPEVVEELAFGKRGFTKHFKGKTWIDCSTVNPSFAEEVHKKCNTLNINYLEAPVAGTKGPAQKGELVFFVGGDKDLMNRHMALFNAMGKKTIHAGAVGKGAAIKMSVNLMLGMSMLAFSEAIALGTKLGVTENTLHTVLLNSPVSPAFLAVIQDKLKTKSTTANFPLEWMHKDLALALKSASELQVSLPSTQAGEETFREAVKKRRREDFSSIYHHIID